MRKARLHKITDKRVRDLLEKGRLPDPRKVPEDLDSEIKLGIRNMAETAGRTHRRVPFLTKPRLIFSLAALGTAAAVVILLVYIGGVPAGDSARTTLAYIPHVTATAGTALVKEKNAPDWRPLVLGAAIGENAVIKAGANSRITLEYPDGAFLIVGDDSTVVLRPEFEAHPTVELEDGGVDVDEDGGKESSLRVIADNVVFTPIGTTFSVTYDRKRKMSTLNVAVGSVAAQRLFPENELANDLRKNADWLYPALEAFINETLITEAGRETTFHHGNIRTSIIRVKEISQKALDAGRTGRRITPDEKQRIIKNLEALRPINAGAADSAKPQPADAAAPQSTDTVTPTPQPAQKEITTPPPAKEKKPFSYTTDFESGEAPPFSTTEWVVKTDDDGNRVFAPLPAMEGNADALFFLKSSGNLKADFRLKRLPGKEGTCWTAIDLGTAARTAADNDWIIIENDKITFGNRRNERVYRTAGVGVKPGGWHELSIEVRDGVTVSIAVDKASVLTYRLEEKKEYTFLKIESDPEMGAWYIDDFSVFSVD
jgi:hypothetical protein